MKFLAAGVLAFTLLSMTAAPMFAGDPVVAENAGNQYTLAMQGMT